MLKDRVFRRTSRECCIMTWLPGEYDERVEKRGSWPELLKEPASTDSIFPCVPARDASGDGVSTAGV